MKSKLKEHLVCGIFIAGLHKEVNVFTFRYIAASIVFQQCHSFASKERCTLLGKSN